MLEYIAQHKPMVDDQIKELDLPFEPITYRKQKQYLHNNGEEHTHKKRWKEGSKQPPTWHKGLEHEVLYLVKGNEILQFSGKGWNPHYEPPERGAGDLANDPDHYDL